MKKHQKPELFRPTEEEVSAAAKRLVVESVSKNTTAMTKKQEKIKEAYGQYWDLVKDLVRSDGSLKESVWFGSEIDIPYHDLSTGYLRPNALRGISDNNRWISIESEADFPKNKLDHSFVYSLKENMISSIQLNIVRNDQIEELFEDDWITHYQPIVKPQPPIY